MKIKYLLLAIFTIQFCYINAQFNLTDTWELYNQDGSMVASNISMNITQTGDIINASGFNWVGDGQFNSTTNSGYYNWTFADGKTGVTTFDYISEFDRMEGSVSGSGIDWNFYARRTSKPLADFTGSYKLPTVSTFILIIKQSFDKIDVFFKDLNFHYYGSGRVMGNFAVVDWSRIAILAPTLTVVASGRYYFYLSNDMESVSKRDYLFDPPELSGSAGSGFNPLPLVRNPTTTAVSPPAGWIGIDGNQPCFPMGSGYELSCQSPDDFEESGFCMDPRTIILIDNWLSKAKPIAGWDKAWYDCWGRWVGTSRNGETRGNCHRPETGGKTRCEYVLEQLKTKLPQVDASILPSLYLRGYILEELNKG